LLEVILVPVRCPGKSGYWAHFLFIRQLAQAWETGDDVTLDIFMDPPATATIGDGVIVVDKPAGWTSHDVVAKMRGIAHTKRIGHLGTLDPMATGVLPLVLNGATRLAQFYGGNSKLYEGVIHFGYATNSYDADGEPMGEVRDVEPDARQLAEAVERFRGAIQQVPPAVSAKKINGVRAYKLARKEIDVVMKPVEVTVHTFDIVSCDGADVSVRVHCSAGTYVRSLAHDLGQVLGCGAHLKALRRIASGEFRVDQARTIAELQELSDEGRLDQALIPAAELLPDFPSEAVDDLTAGQIRQGRDFRVSPFRVGPEAKFVKAIEPNGRLVAIGAAKMPHLYHPVLVLS
jgi:tRNA pseudouridine55 synthase